MNLEVRRGQTVYLSDKQKLHELEVLGGRRIVDVEEDIECTCKCGTRYCKSQLGDEFQPDFCSCCGKKIFKDQLKGVEIKRITRVYHEQIIRQIQQKLDEIGVRYTRDNERDVFACGTGGKVKVVLVGFSKVLDILHMGEGNNCFFIHLNDADDRAFVRPWQSQSAGIIEFLEGNMRSAIETISVDIQPRSSTKEEQLNRAIAKGPYFFENEFLSFFVKKIREKDAVLRSFLARIKQLGQLMNTKLVTLGAAGDSDFYFIPLAEYILEGLNPDKHGEVKAYCESSQFNMDKYGKANLHAYNHDLLIIVSTNNVQKEVWKTIITVRDAEHRFKHVLFDREIMLLLLGVLDIDLSGVLNE